MKYYRIYCDEGIARQYAGTVKPIVGNTWCVKFSEGFQYYCSGFEGLLEECLSYLRQCFRGHLEPIDTEKTSCR